MVKWLGKKKGIAITMVMIMLLTLLPVDMNWADEASMIVGNESIPVSTESIADETITSTEDISSEDMLSTETAASETMLSEEGAISETMQPVEENISEKEIATEVQPIEKESKLMVQKASNNQVLNVTNSSVSVNGNTLTSTGSTQVNNGDKIDIKIEWRIPNSEDDRDPNYIYEYNLNATGIALSDIKDGIVFSNSIEVGKYSITSGVLTIQITDEQFLKESELTGYVNLEGVVDIKNDAINNEGESSISIADKTYNVTVGQSDPNASFLNVSKSAVEKNANAEGDSKIQSFQIVIQSTGANTNINLSDIAGSNLSLVPGSIVVSGDNNAGTITQNGNSFDYRIASMSDGQQITITYQMEIADVAYSNSNNFNWDTLKNTVDYQYTDDRNHVQDPWDPNAFVTVSKPDVRKSGVYSESAQNVTWTVEINGNDLSLEGATITDVVGEHLNEATGDMTITYIGMDWQEFATDTVSADRLFNGGYVIPNQAEKIRMVRIKYETKVDDDYTEHFVDKSVNNTVNVKFDDSIEYTQEGIATIGKQQIVEKACVSSQNSVQSNDDVIAWETVITVPVGGFQDLEYSDYIRENHVLDGEITVIPAINPTIVKDNANNSFKVSFGEVVNNSDSPMEIVITYNTKPTNIDDQLLNYVYNNDAQITFKLNDEIASQSANGKYEFVKTNVVSKSSNPWWFSNELYEKEKMELKWAIEIDLTSYTDASQITELIVTDTLPTDMTLKENMLFVAPSSGTWNKDAFSKNPAGIATTVADNIVTFNITQYAKDLLTNGGEKKFTIGYVSNFDNFDDYLEWAGSYVVNTVEVKNGDSYIGNASASQYVDQIGNVIDKVGLYSEATAPYVEYTIEVNKEGLDLFADGETLTVTDVMGSALSLQPNSIILYEGDGVTKMDTSKYSVTYDIANNTIKTVIPDATHLFIKYKAKIDLEIGTDMSNHDTTNTVSIEGFSSNKSFSTTKINGTVLESSAGASSVTGSLVIYKYNQNITNYLTGARFTVWMVNYDESTGTFSDAPVNEAIGYTGPKEITTGSNGQSNITGLVYDRIYAIKETRAPAGYAINPETFYFIIKGSEGKTLPEGVESFLTSGQIMYIEDEIATDGYFSISKREIGTSTGVKDAILELYAKEGVGYATVPSLTFTSDIAPTTITVVSDGTTPNTSLNEIAPGSYKLVEKTAPAGYEIANEITFDVAADGTLSNVVNGNVIDANKTLVMYDTVIEIGIEKRKDNASGDYLSGAELTLTDSNGDIVTTITTNGAKATISNLVAGETYTLSETTTPAGYITATDIVFMVNEDGTITVTSGMDANTGNGTVTDNDTIVMVDVINETAMTISKQIANTDTELAGAALALYKDNKNGLPIKEWTTTTTAEEFTIKLNGDIDQNEIEPGDYILVEMVAPAGYVYSEDITFTVTTDGKVLMDGTEVIDNKVVMEDAPYNIYLDKRDMSDHTVLTGAEFTLDKIDGGNATQITTWTSTEEAFVIQGTSLEIGATYRLTETTTPQITKGGYDFSYVKMDPVFFTITKSGDVQILTGDGQTANDRIGVDIQVGSYDNTISVNNKLVLYNKVITPSNFLISKRETGVGNELAGATLQLYSAIDNELIDEWVTGDAPKSIWVFNDETAYNDFNVSDDAIKIMVGDYYLIETSAPFGYERIVRHDFTINTQYDSVNNVGIVTFDSLNATSGASMIDIVNNNTVVNGTHSQDLVVNNDMKTLIISKQALGGGPELPGATIEIFKKNTTTGEYDTTGISWVSTDTAKVLPLDELGEGDFKLVETGAPDGYAYTDDLEFSIIVDATSGETLVKDDAGATVDELTMFDEALALSIQKTDENGAALSNATFVLKDSKNVPVDTWISDGMAHSVASDKLIAGEQYTLSETEAPGGYTVMEDVIFTVNKDGSLTLDASVTHASVNGTTIVAKDTAINLRIKKVNSSNRALPGAKLTLRDSGDNTIAEGTTNSNGELELDAEAIGKLKVGETYTYTLIEMDAPAGYALAQPIVFTISEDGTITRMDGVAVQDYSIVMVDEEVGISFLKTDAHGTPITGARLRIEAVEANDDFAAVEWESSTIPFSISGTRFKAGNRYRMSEVTAPNGYKYTSDVIFTYSSNGTIYLTGNYSNAVASNTQLAMVDEELDLYVSKTDLAGSVEIPGAILTIVNATTDEVVDSWISSNVPHAIKKDKLAAGESYKLIEEVAPQGYTVTTEVAFAVEKDGTITTTNTNVLVDDYLTGNDNLLKLKDDTIDLKIAKVDEDGQYLAGATLELREKATDTLIETIAGDGSPVQIPFLKLKSDTTYVLTEISAPVGYAISAPIEFTITKEGNIVRKDNVAVTDNTVIMIDSEIGVFITKEDMGGNTLPGATLEITSVEDTTFQMDSWVSTNTPKNISLKLLKPDMEYILTETIAPKGYSQAESIVFKVDESGNVYVKSGDVFNKVTDSTVTMQDKALELMVSKRVKGTDTALSGATLNILDEETGEDVYSFVSGTESAKIPSNVLTAGTKDKAKTYILTELQAPAGYSLAPAIYFAVDYAGKVYYKDATGSYVIADNNTLVMYDEPSEITISKQDGNGNALVGATLTILSNVDSAFTPVSWVTTAEKKVFDIKSFKRNTDYILTETRAPQGYSYAKDIVFQIDDNGRVVVEGQIQENNMITMIDVAFGLKVEKKIKDSSTYLEGAQLSIIEESSGTEVYTWTSTTSAQTIPGEYLKASKAGEKIVYILRETKAPTGYKLAEDIRFYIADDGKVYIIEGDGVETLSSDNIITMYDETQDVDDEKEEDIEDEEEKEEEEEDEEDTSISTSDKKTGDSSPLLILFTLLLFSLIGLCFAIYFRKKLRR